MGVAIAGHWFERKTIDADITLLWEPHVDPLLRCNIWHVRGRDRDLMIDTGLGICSLRQAAKDLLEKKVVAVATHSHYDHVGSMCEFDTKVIHKLEAEELASPSTDWSLVADQMSGEFRQYLAEVGYGLSEELLTAYPYPGYDIRAYQLPPATPTWLVDEGDVIDVGNRAFEVIHLPGHSPGSIGLWEAKTGILFSGDAIYDGPLLDRLAGSNIDDYIKTMRRLQELPVSVVHAGHDPSFDRDRLRDIATSYLKSKGC